VEKAVAEVNGKELLGREMKVQKATSGGPYTSENGEHGDAPSGETRKARPKPRAKVPISFAGSYSSLANYLKATPRRTREAGSEERADSADVDPEASSEQTARPRRQRFQKKVAEEGGVSEDAETSGDRKKTTRKPLRKGPPEDGTPSTTTIYVANIPFEYSDDKVSAVDICRSSFS
jgi:RNA recognition motif-containing protein